MDGAGPGRPGGLLPFIFTCDSPFMTSTKLRVDDEAEREMASTELGVQRQLPRGRPGGDPHYCPGGLSRLTPAKVHSFCPSWSVARSGKRSAPHARHSWVANPPASGDRRVPSSARRRNVSAKVVMLVSDGSMDGTKAARARTRHPSRPPRPVQGPAVSIAARAAARLTSVPEARPRGRPQARRWSGEHRQTRLHVDPSQRHRHRPEPRRPTPMSGCPRNCLRPIRRTLPSSLLCAPQTSQRESATAETRPERNLLMPFPGGTRHPVSGEPGQAPCSS